MRLAALIAALLVGCVSGGGITEATDSWDGAAYDEVVLSWGAPARSAKLTDGRDVYTWVSESAGTRGRVSPCGGGIGIGTGIMFGSGGGESVRCERTLIFKDGRVDEQNWQGPAEYCRSFGRLAR